MTISKCNIPRNSRLAFVSGFEVVDNLCSRMACTTGRIVWRAPRLHRCTSSSQHPHSTNNRNQEEVESILVRPNILRSLIECQSNCRQLSNPVRATWEFSQLIDLSSQINSSGFDRCSSTHYTVHFAIKCKLLPFNLHLRLGTANCLYQSQTRSPPKLPLRLVRGRFKQ